MSSSLQGKVALVSGAASGIGRTTAQTFAREGAKVLIADINVSGGEETVDFIKKAGGEAIFVKTDVTQRADVEAMVNEAVRAFGGLDCAFNNSGINGVLASIVEDTEENWDRVVDINLKGVWLCMKYEITHMVTHGGGSIVNTSSIGGFIGWAGCIPYVAAKHGVIGLARAATMAYADKGIRVNTVCPGYILTPMSEHLMSLQSNLTEAQASVEIPMGRMGRPKDIAETVVWLCSDAASFISGHALCVDGGSLAGHYPFGAK
jgi:NAD(P)-dependent dehydrogenase (short-subunit alcohol dehydrogenase family)